MNKWLNKNLWWLSITASTALLFYVAAPNWVTNPNGEVKPYQYYDVENVFSKTERRAFRYEPGEEIVETRHGYCPDIAMQTTKAMLDKKLTNYEMHLLRKEAKRLFDQANMITRKNDALVAAGQKPLPFTIDCPKGNELFN